MSSGVWHPVRRRMVERAAESPATLSDLAEAAGVHLNTARAHLSVLEGSGTLVPEQAPPGGRGRPPLHYRLADDFALPGPGLAEVLAAAVMRSGQSADELRRVGVEWGRLQGGSGDLEQTLPRALERLGFDAVFEDGELVLSACPCRLVAPGSPELVCNLAIAVAEGVLEGAGSGLRISSRSHDPARRHCSAALTS
jgi:predicted ArsR family transcriptional regulator